MFPADGLAALTHVFNKGHHHAGLVAVEACVVPGVTGILVGLVVILLFNIGPVQSPCWIPASFNACLRWSSSSLSNWLLEQTVT